MLYMYMAQNQTSLLNIEIRIAESKSFYRIDTNHMIYEKITFQGTPAYLGHGLTTDDQETYVMIWVKDGIEYNIYGTVSLSELFEIAENIY